MLLRNDCRAADLEIEGQGNGLTLVALPPNRLVASPGILAPDRQGEAPRVIIVTDAGGDPDDQPSLIRFLVCRKSLEHLKYKWNQKTIMFTLRTTKD